MPKPVKSTPESIKPKPENIKEYCKKWKTHEDLKHYVLQERSLEKLFTTYPANANLEDVLIKVTCLNEFYSTNIYKPLNVANHIISLKIDSRLPNKDLTLVNKIARVKLKDKEINFYSFATKYCSHHFPEYYPIYDWYIGEMLFHFQKTDHFSASFLKKEDLKDYCKFRRILKEFIEYYQLKNFKLKEIDRYLWLAGKDFFGSRSKKKSS